MPNAAIAVTQVEASDRRAAVERIGLMSSVSMRVSAATDKFNGAEANASRRVISESRELSDKVI
jgi:hypothetical protein